MADRLDEIKKRTALPAGDLAKLNARLEELEADIARYRGKVQEQEHQIHDLMPSNLARRVEELEGKIKGALRGGEAIGRQHALDRAAEVLPDRSLMRWDLPMIQKGSYQQGWDDALREKAAAIRKLKEPQDGP